ncbi:hypothetical protein JCM9279_006639 [Rhodotorula babjevae]
MASTAFTDDFTANHGGLCFFVDVDPAFDHQARPRPSHSVSEAATVLARSRPEGDRSAFIQDLVDQATAALPPAPEPAHRDDDDEEDEEEPPKAQDTPESRQAKRQVVARLVQSLDGHRLEASSDKEFEGLANLVLALVLSHYTPADTEYPSLLSTLADALTTTASSSSSSTSSTSTSTSTKASAAPSLAARYASLATLFNALPTEGAADLRLSLLLKLVAFAASNDDLSVVAPALAKLEHWLAEWNLGADKSDAAVRDVVAHLVAHGHAKQARELVASHLAAASNDAQSSVAPELAATLVALSLAAPDVYDFHALTPARLPALASLPSSLSTLLSRFQQSSSSSSPSSSDIPQDALEAVPAVPLSKAQLEHKLRLVQLADLCAERVGQTVSYDEIAKACGVEAQKGSEEESEEVEGWVIDAIRASLLLGRLSQPSRTLAVSRASPVQAFTPQHWATVQQRLEGWKVSLGRVRASVDRALGVSSGAGAAEVVGGAGGDRRRGGDQHHDDEQ